jgi:hypothetical protein
MSVFWSHYIYTTLGAAEFFIGVPGLFIIAALGPYTPMGRLKRRLSYGFVGLDAKQRRQIMADKGAFVLSILAFVFMFTLTLAVLLERDSNRFLDYLFIMFTCVTLSLLFVAFKLGADVIVNRTIGRAELNAELIRLRLYREDGEHLFGNLDYEAYERLLKETEPERMKEASISSSCL